MMRSQFYKQLAQLHRELIEMGALCEQAIAHGGGDGEGALDILMVAKYFERIGDHATNIAEWVEFSVTGVHKEETT